jgi:hypothetical protein
MFKSVLLENIQNTAVAWFSAHNPSVNSARLEFSARVYNSERNVLNARKIVVK